MENILFVRSDGKIAAYWDNLLDYVVENERKTVPDDRLDPLSRRVQNIQQELENLYPGTTIDNRLNAITFGTDKQVTAFLLRFG